VYVLLVSPYLVRPLVRQAATLEGSSLMPEIRFTVLALEFVYDSSSSNSISYSFVNITLCYDHRLSGYLGVY
jgi:hypothetical protein